MRKPFQYQEVPRCFGCSQPIEHDVVFASLCEHDTCPSTTWHYHHLMQVRENAQKHNHHHTELFEVVLNALDALWDEL